MSLLSLKYVNIGRNLCVQKLRTGFPVRVYHKGNSSRRDGGRDNRVKDKYFFLKKGWDVKSRSWQWRHKHTWTRKNRAKMEKRRGKKKGDEKGLRRRERRDWMTNIRTKRTKGTNINTNKDSNLDCSRRGKSAVTEKDEREGNKWASEEKNKREWKQKTVEKRTEKRKMMEEQDKEEETAEWRHRQGKKRTMKLSTSSRSASTCRSASTQRLVCSYTHSHTQSDKQINVHHKGKLAWLYTQYNTVHELQCERHTLSPTPSSVHYDVIKTGSTVLYCIGLMHTKTCGHNRAVVIYGSVKLALWSGPESLLFHFNW